MNEEITTQDSPYSFSRPILVMDICTIGIVKERESILLNEDERKKNRLHQIIELVKSGKYRFSFILAIIEKATDVKHPMTGQQMTERFLRDHEMISDLIGVNNILETTEALENIIPRYMSSEFSPEERAELALSSYLEQLSFYDSLNVEDKPKKEKMLSRAKDITDKATALGIGSGHPVITVCVAAVCGCKDAWRILRRKRGVFNPSNALGDIQSFFRMARVKSLINSKMPGVEVVFRTEDEGLENMHKYYVYDHDIRTGKLNLRLLDTNMMFPLLYDEAGNEDEDMLYELYEMLSFEKKQSLL
ncbi:hypothetical protein [Erwinia sp. MYb535]|uniref:hypothetical protein n=1 Tax=Erwinia sp. MYb535 TaxID=2745309 RepID=UPI003098D7B6